MEKNLVEIRNFSKTYAGNKKAVDNLSLIIESGDIYGFIGHNGAGKTTTIKAIAGILDFESGDICIDGHDVKKEEIKCKSMLAYIPDNPDIYEHLTGIEYLNFIADVFFIDIKTREEKIKYYADEFEITNSLGDLVSSYSHGMKQKLVIISALIHSPKLLLLDEPFVGLDPVATLKLKNMMKKMCEEGSAIFFSTHVLDVAEKLCNKVAIIKQGKLVEQGLIKDLTRNASLEETFMEVVNYEKSEK